MIPEGAAVLLRTERLVVRRFDAGDIETLHTYRNDEGTAAKQGWSTPWPYDDAVMLVAEMALRDPLFERGEWAQLAVQRDDDPTLIGDIAAAFSPADAPY